MADTDLLPCPFCGGKATSWPEAYSDENPNEVIAPSVTKCDDCGAMVYGDWQDESVAAWNRRAPSPSPAPGVVEGQAAGDAESPLEWAVRKWHHEVANRPLENVHRAALDTTWRQVIRHFGGDAEALCGPDHYTLVEQNPAALASLSQPAKEREGGR